MFESNIYQDVSFFPQPQNMGDVGQFTGASFRSESEFKVWIAQQQRIEELENRISILENNVQSRVGLSVLVSDLNDPHFILKKPLSLLVYRENTRFYAVPIDFDLFGEGWDERSAIDDLKNVIVSYFINLNVSKKFLSEKLKAKFILMESFISYEA